MQMMNNFISHLTHIQLFPAWIVIILAIVITVIMQAKGAKILGVFWPNDLEVVVVTDKGVEHYQVVMVVMMDVE